MRDKLKLIKATIRILDSPDYAHYSEGRADNYLDYFKGQRADEDRLIAHVLLRRFLEQILGFKLGETIGTQESGADGKPDFIPIDKQIHPFVFDAKGSDTEDLSVHYGEKRKYLEAHGFQYLILVNMRDLAVFTLESPEPLDEYSFSFYKLYQDFQENPKDVLKRENTRRLFRFIEKFRYRELSLEEKLERVKGAKPWTGGEELNVEFLTKRLKHIVNILYEDAKRGKAELADLPRFDPERAQSIAQEVELIASEISPTHKLEEATEETLAGALEAPSTDLYGKAIDTFLYRVAYFTMTRLLLVRMWEDIGFIDQTLYDGGLDKWYETFNHELAMVLKHAFDLAAKRYEWLFAVPNNYSWYKPSNEALINVLYELSNFNLGKLNRDVLGTIYEEYIDRVDKKRKGQYYTPREIVSFIWDRVGYTSGSSFFGLKRGRREPKLVLDPATGSGGFLVEAARRLREESGIDLNDFQDLLDVRSAIFAGLFGSEISVFPYYITEVNLLIQLTPIVKRMIELQKALKGEHLPLAVVRVDSLSLHNANLSLVAEETEEYKADKLHDTLPLDSRKKVIYRKIKEELAGKFAYCCANPPYVGEKGHKELFRSTLDRYPYWKQFYQGKMDYLYWFIILGLSKLREGGKLGFITTAYWPTADGAAKLRRFILENAKIKEMVFFEDVKIFEHAKGQHNMVFVLEKCSGKEKAKEREENRIKVARVLAKHPDIPGETIPEKLRFLTHHLLEHLDKDEYEDRYIEVFWSGVKQGELPKNGGSWNDLFSPPAVKDFIDKVESSGESLENLCHILQGIVSGADRVTRGNINLLPKGKIEHDDIEPGDGIFVLSEQEKRSLGLPPSEESLVKPTYKNSDIGPYLVDLEDSEKLYIIYTTKKTDINSYRNIRAHLEKFKEILKDRLDRYEESYPWYCLHRERDGSLLASVKIVTPRWGEELKPFALQGRSFYENSDINLIVKKKGIRENIRYLLGLLNSSLIKFWMLEKARQKGLTRQSILFKIPIHRIDFNNSDEVARHNAIVKKVKAIRRKMMELSQYSKYFTGPRLTKLGFDEPLPELDERAVIEALSDKQIYSIRTHPLIKIIQPAKFEDSGFRLQKVSGVADALEGPELKLIAKDKTELILAGPRDLLELLARLLHGWRGKQWDEIKENLLLPESVSEFGKRRKEILSTVDKLRTETAMLQEEIDQIVYRLYGVEDPKRKARLKAELERISKILIERYKPERIILFGSLVNGSVHQWSDLDILILKRTKKRYLDRVLKVLNLIKPKLAMDLFVLTPEELQKMLDEGNHYIEEIIEKGQVIYERSS